MTDEELKNALIETQDFILRQLPSSDSYHEFPRRVRRTVRKLIRKEMHPIWFEIQRVAAIIFIMLGITSVVILGFNEEARAGVLGWIRERVSSNTIQYENQSHGDKDIFEYSLKGILSDEYHIVQREEKGEKVSERYFNDVGEMVLFVVMSPDYDGSFQIFSTEENMDSPIYIEELSADLYISKIPNEANIITWQSNDGTRFIIQGIIEQEELIRIAKEIE